jgi:SUMO ligase MMS21 Smc5/6 complex component
LNALVPPKASCAALASGRSRRITLQKSLLLIRSFNSFVPSSLPFLYATMSVAGETEIIYSDGAIQAAVATANNIRNRDFRGAIGHNSEMAIDFASSLGEDLGASLSGYLDDDDEMKKECEEFLKEQKARLVKTAVVNVEQQRQIQAFVTGLQRVQQTLVEQGQQVEQDYSQVLATEMQTAEETQAAEQLEMHQEPLVRAIQTKLGMKLSAASGNESDNELEVLPTGSSVQGLKCPISASFFVEPIKSKVCGHVYSQDALRQLLGMHSGHRGMACPISGCINQHLTMESCAPDRSTKQKVNRYLRNQAAAEEVRMSQAVDLDSMDEEEF